MDRPRDYYSKKEIIIVSYKNDTTYMWDLKKMIQMNLFIKQKQTHRKQIYGFQRGEAVGEGQIRTWGLADTTIMYKINNKVLVYSTREVYLISCNKP